MEQQLPAGARIIPADIPETYIDVVNWSMYDGSAIKMELLVRRFIQGPDGQYASTLHPVCRLVMSLPTFLDMEKVVQGTRQDIEKRVPGAIQKASG